MRRLILICWMLSSTAFAQLAPPSVERTPSSCKMTWAAGSQTMFLQYSLDLQTWSFFPEIESGPGNYEYNFSTSADKMFVRLKYTNTVVADPENHDFDGDGLTSINELTLTMTDPLESDTDGDTLLDGWEVANDNGSTNITNGASGDPDNDGLTNAEEQQNNTDPNSSDSDGDGITDGGEVDQGNDPNDTPDAEWFILTGDLAKDIQKARTRTEIDENGETAIRANLAPVGFNKGRLQIAVVDFVGDPAKVADMEVPPVVVIDPGHGGNINLAGSSQNNATSPTGVLEKNMALSYGTELQTALNAWATANDSPFARMMITRTTDTNLSGAARAALGRDNGADVIFIIHFNAFNGVARGTLEVRRTNGNVNGQEDINFIDRVLDDIVPAMQGFDAAANRRASVAFNSAVASDTNLGNVAAYHPLRAGYCEVEFIDNPQVDQLPNHGPNAAAVRAAVANAAADAIIEDIRHQPNP